MALCCLSIEDDEIERLKLERVLRKNQWNHKIIHAINGELALEILTEKKIKPDLIFLDLNMPKMNGLEFLKILKTDNALHHIPVVILSTSNNHQDLKKCYEIGIAGYVVKPLRFEDYTNKINSIMAYWSINEFVNS